MRNMNSSVLAKNKEARFIPEQGFRSKNKQRFLSQCQSSFQRQQQSEAYFAEESILSSNDNPPKLFKSSFKNQPISKKQIVMEKVRKTGDQALFKSKKQATKIVIDLSESQMDEDIQEFSSTNMKPKMVYASKETIKLASLNRKNLNSMGFSRLINFTEFEENKTNFEKTIKLKNQNRKKSRESEESKCDSLMKNKESSSFMNQNQLIDEGRQKMRKYSNQPKTNKKQKEREKINILREEDSQLKHREEKSISIQQRSNKTKHSLRQKSNSTKLILDRSTTKHDQTNQSFQFGFPKSSNISTPHNQSFQMNFIMQNNEYLQKMNETVVNKLFSLLQIKQVNIVQSMNQKGFEKKKDFIEQKVLIERMETQVTQNKGKEQSPNKKRSDNNLKQNNCPVQENLRKQSPTKCKTSSNKSSSRSSNNKNNQIKQREKQISILEGKRRNREFNNFYTSKSNIQKNKTENQCINDENLINQSTFVQKFTPRDVQDHSSHNISHHFTNEDEISAIKIRVNKQSLHSVQCERVLEAQLGLSKQNQIQDEGNLSTREKNGGKMMKKKNKVKEVEVNSNMSTNFNSNAVSNKQGNVQQRSNTNNLNSILVPHENKIIQKQIKENKNKDEEVKAAVFMQISLNQTNQFKEMSLAQAFKMRIGKLPTRAERKAKVLKQKQNIAKEQATEKLKELNELNLAEASNKDRLQNIKQEMNQEQKERKKTVKKEKKKQIQVDTRTFGSKINQNNFITPKARQPSQQLLNRLIGGSKAKISKKQMYALTRKNYENLPQVQEKKRLQIKKQQQIQRLQRIKSYQKSIRASKNLI